jgi:ABC-type uncharacterized transport system permease subunit
MYKKDYFDNSNREDDFEDIEDIDIKELRNINICSSNIYNNTIFIILGGIILFFVWYVSTRSYIQAEDLTIKTTPFS